jgi:TonB family protein
MIMQTYYTQLKQWIILLLLGFILPTVYAQTPTDTTNIKDTVNGGTVCITVDEYPEFPGGEIARAKFLQDNIVYPKDALEKKIQGRVRIEFKILKTGEMTEIKVAQSVHPLLDNEALRVVRLMPNWKPAKSNGEAVEFIQCIPVRFTLP